MNTYQNDFARRRVPRRHSFHNDTHTVLERDRDRDRDRDKERARTGPSAESSPGPSPALPQRVSTPTGPKGGSFEPIPLVPNGPKRSIPEALAEVLHKSQEIGLIKKEISILDCKIARQEKEAKVTALVLARIPSVLELEQNALNGISTLKQEREMLLNRLQATKELLDRETDNFISCLKEANAKSIQTLQDKVDRLSEKLAKKEGENTKLEGRMAACEKDMAKLQADVAANKRE